MNITKYFEEKLDTAIAVTKANGELIKVLDCEFYEINISIPKEILKDIIDFFEACTMCIKGFVKETNKYIFPDTVNFHGKKETKYFNFSIYIREDSIHILIKK